MFATAPKAVGTTVMWKVRPRAELPESGWRFHDGELSDDENLIAVFQRREAKH